VVPVFFATNRTYVGKNGSVEYSEEQNDDGLLYGVKNVLVPFPVRTPLDLTTENRMQWQRFKIDHDAKRLSPNVPHELCSIRNATLTRDELVAAFDSCRDHAGSKESVIFLHGCCATFDTSITRAAKVASHMQVPVLLYDWVSPKGFTRYLENETLAEQTVDGFLSSLRTAKKTLGAEYMTLLAHSMGALILDRAMVRRNGWSDENVSGEKFKELIMSNADVDGKTFLNHAKLFASNASKTRVYFNRTDDRLRTAALAHGGFRRLGSPGSLTDALAKIPELEMIDITDARTNHELPYWIVSNMHRFGNLGPVKDFRLQKQDTGVFDLQRTGAPLAEPSGLE
jgi:esterase/lipase superfamily enzyme